MSSNVQGMHVNTTENTTETTKTKGKRKTAKAERGLFQRPGSPYWWLRWTENGTEKRESSKTTDKTKAKAMLASKLEDAWTARAFPALHRKAAEEEAQSTTVSEALDEYLKAGAMKGKNEGHARTGWERPVIARLRAALGSRAIGSLTKADVTAYLAGLKVHPRKDYTVLSAAVKLSGSTMPRGCKVPDENDHRTRRVSDDEWTRLMSNADPELRAFATVLLATGMRRRELAGLTWDRLDLGRRIVTLRDEDTKTGKGRPVPLTMEAVEALKALPRRIDGNVWTPPPSGLARKIGEGLGRRWAKLTKALGIVNLHLHDLRHEYASRLGAGGANAILIAKVLGHSDTRVTMKYVNPAHAELVAAVDQYLATTKTA